MENGWFINEVNQFNKTKQFMFNINVMMIPKKKKKMVKKKKKWVKYPISS